MAIDHWSNETLYPIDFWSSLVLTFAVLAVYASLHLLGVYDDFVD